MGDGEWFAGVVRGVFGGELVVEVFGWEFDEVVGSVFGDDVGVVVLAGGGGKALLEM
jgi:putative lipase involved disintegration of autophagic bodies